MATYVVMQPERADGRIDAEGAIFVRDGFALIAFLVPMVWLLWHRLWIEAALALALTVGLTALGNVAGFGFAAPVLSLLVSIYAGLEGSALRLAALRRRGWHDFGVVEADSYDDAETRYLIETGSISEAGIERHDPVPGPAAARKTGPEFGLLLNPGNS
jgi:Protein of unknown function (DUF2628)